MCVRTTYKIVKSFLIKLIIMLIIASYILPVFRQALTIDKRATLPKGIRSTPKALRTTPGVQGLTPTVIFNMIKIINISKYLL